MFEHDGGARAARTGAERAPDAEAIA